MARRITVGAAQLGAIQKADTRAMAVDRMLALMAEGHRRGVELIVFPELALTTFFPRHYHEDIAEADGWFETAMPSNETAPLFEAARRYRMGFHLGYAETARCTCPGMRSSTRSGRCSTWRSAISRWATWASPSSAPAWGASPTG